MDLDEVEELFSWRYCVWEPIDGTYNWIGDWYALPCRSHPVGGLPVYKVFVNRFGEIMDEVRISKEWVWITQ